MEKADKEIEQDMERTHTIDLEMMDIEAGNVINNDPVSIIDLECANNELNDEKNGTTQRDVEKDESNKTEEAKEIVWVEKHEAAEQEGRMLQDDAGKNEESARSKERKDRSSSINQKRRKSSFIRPDNAPTFTKSLAYAVETVMWLFYHSSVLNVLPLVTTFIIFGAPWLFEINYQNMLIHFLATTSFLIATQYFTIYILSLYLFGRERIQPLLYKITIPLCGVNIMTFIIREVYMIKTMANLNYGVFLLHMYLFLRYVNSTKDSQKGERTDAKKSRYDILSSDGTPIIIFKGYVVYLIPYVVLTIYLIPYIMSSNVFMRIIGRVFIIPFLFNVAESYLNSLIIYKSKEHVKYRMVPGNLMNFISTCILRFMVSSSGSTTNTLLMASTSSVFEIVFRATFIPRTIYTIRLYRHWRKKAFFSCFRKRKVQNLAAVIPQNEQQNGDENQEIDEHVEIDEIELSIEGIRKLFSQLNEEDNMTNYILSYRSNRSYYMSMTGIQLTIMLPIVLHLIEPTRAYFTLQPLRSVDNMFYSMLIQLPAELIAQVGYMSLENYLYGIKVSISKSWSYNAKTVILFQYTCAILMSLNLALSPYRLNTEDWPQ